MRRTSAIVRTFSRLHTRQHKLFRKTMAPNTFSRNCRIADCRDRRALFRSGFNLRCHISLVAGRTFNLLVQPQNWSAIAVGHYCRFDTLLCESVVSLFARAMGDDLPGFVADCGSVGFPESAV